MAQSEVIIVCQPDCDRSVVYSARHQKYVSSEEGLRFMKPENKGGNPII